ncbi:flagellar hook-length control protein FliK [Roseibium hamelinense]|uniref:Flagellar hook-length control protein FliK n=1 Tax=Roseibium hamelinense TaxID=150831 RepID=A0A562SGX3_9HYPH|nr:flagellar hook-length control protein FliK [Roseibium hamelinense]MTI44245.1 flagellar hook-length control protein FliK [Roseibium hamelinense]TWI79970.1 flagellar hook-length control protein FliK [Roseibium hamelinense]
MVGAVQGIPATLPAESAVRSAGLEPGTQVQARVESAGPDNTLRLSVGKSSIEVRASAPLPPGTEVTIKVDGDAARPQIQIIPQKPGVQPQPAAQPAIQPAQPGSQPPAAQTPQTTPQASPATPAPPAPPAAAARPSLAAVLNTQSQSVPQNVVAGPAAGGAGAIGSAPSPTVQVPPTGLPTGQPATSAPVTAQLLNVQSASNPSQGAPLQTGQPQAVQPQAGQTPSSQLPTGQGQSGPAVSQGAGSAPPTAPVQIGSGATLAQVPQSGANLQVSQGPAPQLPGSQSPASPAAIPQNAAPNLAAAQISGVLSSGTPTTSLQGIISQNSGPQQVVRSAAPAPQGAPSVQVGVGTAPLPSAASGQAIQPGGQTAGQGVISQTGPGPVPAGQAPSLSVGGAQTVPGSAPPPGAGQVISNASLQPGQAVRPQPPLVLSGSAAVPQAVAQQGGAGIAGGLAGGGTATGTQWSAQLPASGAAPAGSAGTPLPQISANVTVQPQSVQPLTVQSPQPLQAGYPIKGTPVSLTAPAGQASAAGSGPQPVSAALASAAKTVLPKLQEQQSSLAGLFAQITAMKSAQAASGSKLPDTVDKVMQQILGLRLNSAGGQVTAQSVHNAVKASGIFREGALFSGAKAPLPQQGQPADLKSLLITLRGILQDLGAGSKAAKPFTQPPVPSLAGAPRGQRPAAAASVAGADDADAMNRLLQETDNALSRIRLTQMVSRGLGGDDPQAAQGKPMDVVLELPMTVGQETAIVQMQIGRDREGNQTGEDDDSSWRLRFALDLTATGPLEAAVSLRGGGTFVSVWVERRDTLDMLRAGHETLEATFADAGLNLQELRFLHGLPKRPETPSGAYLDRRS